MSIEREARQHFTETVAATLDRICADLGITPDNAHEHTLQRYVAPDGQWHYVIDGEKVMIADPATNWIEGRIENRAYRESRARESETEQQWSNRASQAIRCYGGESAHTKRVPIFRSSFSGIRRGQMTENDPQTELAIESVRQRLVYLTTYSPVDGRRLTMPEAVAVLRSEVGHCDLELEHLMQRAILRMEGSPKPAVGDISPRTAAFASPGARPMDSLPQPGWRARIRMRLRTLFSRWTSGV